MRLKSNYVVVAGLAASSCWSGQACLARWPALHKRSMLATRQRPARNFILAGEPDIFFPPHVIEDAIEHPDGRGPLADPVMQTHNHHPSPLRALLIKLVELLFQQQFELREIIDREQVMQIVEMGRVGDDADLAFGQGDYERLVAA